VDCPAATVSPELMNPLSRFPVDRSDGWLGCTPRAEVFLFGEAPWPVILGLSPSSKTK